MSQIVSRLSSMTRVSRRSWSCLRSSSPDPLTKNSDEHGFSRQADSSPLLSRLAWARTQRACVSSSPNADTHFRHLAYLFRTINAAISPALAADFGLDAAETGLLASVYFLVFGLAQIPIGAFLDRFGPRRVQGVLLVIAAGGATLFGTASSFPELLVGRAMIGLGVAGSLMAGLKTVATWFPSERVALANGWMIMLGSLGAVTATAPTDWLLELVGWRGLFELLTIATVAVAGLIYMVVPESVADSEVAATDRKPLTLWSI